MDTNTTYAVELIGQKLEKVITVLSEKAGVATDHFWPVLVKQQIIEGWSMVAGFIVMTFFALVSYKVFSLSLEKSHNPDVRHWERNKSLILAIVSGAFGGILIFVVISAGPSVIGKAVGKIHNPEYYAVQSLINFVK